MFNKLNPTLSALYLRALKGAPLTILFFLGDQSQPLAVAQGLTVAHLSRLTGYSRRTVREALAVLVELRLAARCRSQGRAPAYRLIPRDRASLLASDRASPHASEPLMGEPLMDEPLMDEPLMDEPLMDEPLTGKPLAGERLTHPGETSHAGSEIHQP